MKNLFLIIIMSLCTTIVFAQGFYETNEDFKLLNSGKKKLICFKDSKLFYSKTIDSAEGLIIKNLLYPTKILRNKYAPKYDDTFSVSQCKQSFYNSNGTIDSILFIDFQEPMVSVGDGETIPATVDSTLIVYEYNQGKVKLSNSTKYLIKNGRRVIYSSAVYGYNTRDQLILKIEDKGRTQFFYEYDANGNISASYVDSAKTSFEYDKFGRKSKAIYGSSTINYQYDKNLFLLSEVITGKNEGLIFYKYE